MPSTGLAPGCARDVDPGLRAAPATSIMDTNRAGRYELAAQWLEKAALAYEVLGREDDWRACLDDLIDRHRRKYKLRPLLEGLRGA